MRENKIPGSRSLQGGIVVFPRPETPGSWQVMWRTEKGRRYRTFPSLAEANYYASELQRERRTNGARVAHGLMSPEDLKAWTEFREATGHAPLSDLLAAWKDRRTFLSGLPIAELVTKFLAMRQAEGVSKSNCTNDAKRLGRFVAFTGISREQGGYDSPDAEALRNFRRSIYAGAVDAAKRLYLRLLAYGYTAQRFEQGIKSSEPLAELSAKDGARKAFLDALSPYDRRMLDKAERYSERMSSLKVDARRIFPLEIKGFPAATQKTVDKFRENPRVDLLQREMKTGR